MVPIYSTIYYIYQLHNYSIVVALIPITQKRKGVTYMTATATNPSEDDEHGDYTSINSPCNPLGLILTSPILAHNSWNLNHPSDLVSMPANWSPVM